jgi:hypothetical protein
LPVRKGVWLVIHKITCSDRIHFCCHSTVQNDVKALKLSLKQFTL